MTYLPVRQDGMLDLEELQKAIRPDTALVSVMAVNNEIGEREGRKEGEKRVSTSPPLNVPFSPSHMLPPSMHFSPLITTAGVIQPISEIGKICRKAGVFLHSDAAQAVGKVPVSVNDLQVSETKESGRDGGDEGDERDGGDEGDERDERGRRDGRDGRDEKDGKDGWDGILQPASPGPQPGAPNPEPRPLDCSSLCRWT